MNQPWADRLAMIPRCWQTLARGLAAQQPRLPLGELEHAARQLLETVAFVELTRQRRGPRAAEDAPAWARLALAPDISAPVAEPMREAVQACSAVSASELLGQIHQLLLGHRLVRTAGGLRAEPSATARKQAGVYYTPPYVTRYIVATALGATLREPAAAGRPPGVLRMLDPACGCGAFLGEVQRQLGPEAGSALLYGMDLDPEAVLVARRALWLEQPAADLTNTVRCGNVLLESPWGAEARFDLILGNPPYRRELHTKHLLDSLGQTELGRRCRAPRMDYWYYFLHRGLELLRPGGRLAFIVGAYWTSGSGAGKLIDELRQSAQIEEIALLEDAAVFEGVAGRHLILSLTKTAPTRPIRVKRPPAGAVPDAEALLTGRQRWETYEKSPQQLFRSGRIDLEPAADELLEKLAAGTPLGQLGQVRQGIAENPASINRRTNARFGDRWTVGEGVFALAPSELAGLALSDEERRPIRPYFDLCDLGRYELAEQPSRSLIYATAESWPSSEQYPALAAHLERFRPILEERRETRRGLRGWWQLHWPREASLWEAPKILSVQMGVRPAFVPATGPVYVPFSVNVFVPAAEVREHRYYLTALLNSRLLWKWYQHHAKRRGVGLEVNVGVLAQSPICRIDFGQPDEVRRHDQIVALVEERLQAGCLPPPQVDALEEALDRAVYELYGLSAAEIALVEEGTRRPTAGSYPGGRG